MAINNSAAVNLRKAKTSELSGKARDWAVREVLLKTLRQPHLGLLVHQVGYGHAPDSYSTEWSQGGPIIEREKIYLNCLRKGDHYRTEIWEAWPYDSAKLVQQGATPLIAAMRCYVASKLGDEVEIPEELK